MAQEGKKIDIKIAQRFERSEQTQKSAFNGRHTLECNVKNRAVMDLQEHTYYHFIILMTFTISNRT